MHRLLIARQTKSISLDLVEKFSGKVLVPLGYSIRLMPADEKILPKYHFAPFYDIDRNIRSVIIFKNMTKGTNT